MSRSTCTIPLLCSKNFNTNQTTIRIEPTIQSILNAFHFTHPQTNQLGLGLGFALPFENSSARSPVLEGSPAMMSIPEPEGRATTRRGGVAAAWFATDDKDSFSFQTLAGSVWQLDFLCASI